MFVYLVLLPCHYNETDGKECGADHHGKALAAAASRLFEVQLNLIRPRLLDVGSCYGEGVRCPLIHRRNVAKMADLRFESTRIPARRAGVTPAAMATHSEGLLDKA